MKKISLILLLLSTCNKVSAMNAKYQLETPETITAQLENAGFYFFAKQTNIGQKLGNQYKKPVELLNDIDVLFNNYENNQDPITIDDIHMSTRIKNNGQFKELTRPNVLRILLQRYPRAIEQLQHNNLLELYY